VVLLSASLPSALTGADLAIFAAVFSYLADVTTVESRTLRVTILDIAYLSTMPTGVALGMSTSMFIIFIIIIRGARGSVVVKALCYIPEGRGFDTR
jgi:hypothetical protein